MRSENGIFSRWCLVSVVVLVAACGPNLPKKATKDVADEVAKVSKAFQEMEQASVATANDAWVASAVRSGHPVRLNKSCKEAAKVVRKVSRPIDTAANATKPDPALLDAKWADLAKELNTSTKDCALEPLTNQKRPIAVVLVPSFGDSSYADINVKFNRQFRELIKALSGYYAALARAAAGEDIEKQAAAGKAFADAFGEAAGTASKVAMGADIGPLVKAIGKLVVEIAKAGSEAARYDAIEEALEAVSPETMETIEIALGWSVLYLQAKSVEGTLNDRTKFEVSVFNSWNPKDWVGSEVRLRSAIRATTAARAAASLSLTKGISELSELHEDLTADISKRDGSFEATFKRLFAIAEAANAVREAAGKLNEAKE